jgi:hypothetical protein
MDGSVEKSLSREDLALLMDSYRNTIELHTTLLEQQKQVLQFQHTIIEKQDSILGKQSKVYDQLSILAKSLGSCASNIEESNKSMTKTLSSIKDDVEKEVEKVGTKIEGTRIENITQHSAITNKIYVGMVGSAMIIITLIGLLIKLGGG